MDRADISEADGRTRLGHARAWLAWMLSEVRRMGAWTAPWLVLTGLRRVVVVDRTHLTFTCQGKNGTTWRIPMAFDVLAGRRTEAPLTDRHVGESGKRFDVQTGDGIVSDAITGSPERIA